MLHNKTLNNYLCYYNTRGVIMIKIRLSAILGEKRITQAELARKTGIRPATINEIYHEICDRINIDHLDRICEYLECDIADIMVYEPAVSCFKVMLFFVFAEMFLQFYAKNELLSFFYFMRKFFLFCAKSYNNLILCLKLYRECRQ